MENLFFDFLVHYSMPLAIGEQWYLEQKLLQFSLINTHVSVYGKLSELHFNVTLFSNGGGGGMY